VLARETRGGAVDEMMLFLLCVWLEYYGWKWVGGVVNGIHMQMGERCGCPAW